MHETEISVLCYFYNFVLMSMVNLFAKYKSLGDWNISWGFDEVHKIDHKPSAQLKYYFGFFMAI